MKRLAILLACILLSGTAYAQLHVTEAMLEGRDLKGHCRVVDTLPAGACTVTSEPQCRAYQNGATLMLYTCQAATWTIASAVDLTGTYAWTGAHSFADPVSITSTTNPQFQVNYDGTYYGRFAVASNGNVTISSGSGVVVQTGAGDNLYGRGTIVRVGNADAVDLYYGMITDLGTEYLQWDYSDGQFELTDDLEVQGALSVTGTYMKGPADAAEGTCDAAARYQYKFVTGGAGVADQLVVCMKNASDAYNWVLVVDGGW